jgi:hypothetical protein
MNFMTLINLSLHFKKCSSKQKTLKQIHIKMNSSSYKMLLILKCAF